MTNYFANGSTVADLNFRKSSLIPGYLFHMQKFVKGHLRFFFFFVGDESPEPIQSSKVGLAKYVLILLTELISTLCSE